MDSGDIGDSCRCRDMSGLSLAERGSSLMTLKASGAPRDGEELEEGAPVKASAEIGGSMARRRSQRRRATAAKSGQASAARSGHMRLQCWW
jgi:hypothetical protein